MTWFKFLCWLAGLYVVYYVIVLFWDIACSKKAAADQGWTSELRFESGFQPQRVAHDSPGEQEENPVSALGGVTLKGLFELARARSIEYTRGVPF